MTTPGTNLHSVMREVAEALGEVFTSTATGGSTTTLLDTNMTHPAGYFTKGTLFLAAESRVVTAHTAGQLAFAAATAVTAGVPYAVANARYPRSALLLAVQHALEDYGPVPTALEVDTVEDQTVYSVLDGCYLVEVEGTKNADDWTEVYYWRQMPGTYEVVFDVAPAADTRVRFWYPAPHAALALDADILSSFVPMQRIKWMAAAHAIRWRMGQVRNDEPFLPMLLKECETKAALAANRFGKRTVPQARMARY